MHIFTWSYNFIEVKIVKYFTLSFWKKVWLSIGAYYSPRNSNVPNTLSMRNGFNFFQFSYPGISHYLQCQISDDGKVELTLDDYERIARLLPGDQYELDTRAVLIYDLKDNLIPLVLTFNNVRTGSGIYVSMLYENNGNILGFSIYDPERNYLALSYFNPKNTFLIRVGVGKVVPGKDKTDWEYNIYIYRDKIVQLTTPSQDRGLVWFTRPRNS